MLVTVEADKVEAFRAALPCTGCQLTGRMRRRGRASDGTPIRDMEIVLSPQWHEGLRQALHALPGMRGLSFHGPRAGPWGGGPWNEKRGSALGEAVRRFVFWHVKRSGK